MVIMKEMKVEEPVTNARTDKYAAVEQVLVIIHREGSSNTILRQKSPNWGVFGNGVGLLQQG